MMFHRDMKIEVWVKIPTKIMNTVTTYPKNPFDFFLFQTVKLEKSCRKLFVKMTLDRGQRTSRIRLQGQTKDVYQAESRVKEKLHKIKAELIEQQRDAMLGQLVRSVDLLVSSGFFFHTRNLTKYYRPNSTIYNIKVY